MRKPFQILAGACAAATLAACSGGAATSFPGPASTSFRARSTASLGSWVSSLGGPATPVAVNSPAPSAAPPTTYETPLASDALANSIGINAHVSTMYTSSDYPVVVSLTKSLGVRHVRDAIIADEPGYDTAVALLLGGTAKLDGLTDCAGIAYNSASPTSASDIETFQAAIGGRIEAIEGPNEVDVRNDTNWVADTKACLPALRAALPGVPFVAPSLANPNGNASALGDLSAIVDYGNIHQYFSGHNPGSQGWGDTFSCGIYGGLNWSICLAQIVSASKPLAITETGYNTQTEVDEATQAKYLSRAFLVNLKAGVAFTFAYVLRDYTGGDEFGGDGLIRTDDTVKPAYTAIKNEIAYFSDPGNAAYLTPLALSYANAGLEHELFRKRDGSYVLALWNETSSWNTSNETPVIVTPQSQTVTFAGVPTRVSAESLTDTGSFVSTATVATGNTITLPVDDHVTLLHFTAPFRM